jgi:hypothetical protein
MYCGNVPFIINCKFAKKQEKNNVKLIPANPYRRQKVNNPK